MRPLAVLVALVQSACHHPSAFDQVVLEIKVPVTTIAPGTNDSITVYATNLSNETVTLLFSSPCRLLLRIVSPDGAAVPSTPCPSGTRAVALLPPGGGIDTIINWDGRRDSLGTLVSLPPGSYAVYGVLGQSGGRDVGPVQVHIQ
jgi:hypothetical protein